MIDKRGKAKIMIQQLIDTSEQLGKIRSARALYVSVNMDKEITEYEECINWFRDELFDLLESIE